MMLTFLFVSLTYLEISRLGLFSFFSFFPLLSFFCRGNSLFIYGGVTELGDIEVTLDDCWSLDLNKRDNWKKVCRVVFCVCCYDMYCSVWLDDCWSLDLNKRDNWKKVCSVVFCACVVIICIVVCVWLDDCWSLDLNKRDNWKKVCRVVLCVRVLVY